MRDTIADLWKLFDRGDYLETQELKYLATSAIEGLRYLRARGERLAAAKTVMDLHQIEEYIGARVREQKCISSPS